MQNLYRSALLLVFLFSFAASAQSTFPCDNGARLYFFRNMGGNGSLSYITNYTATPVITDMFTMPNASHNALAANPIDNYLYFQDGTSLYKLDALGGTTLVCNMPFSSAYGCFDNLGRFCSINGNNLVIYDITTCSVVNSYTLPSLNGFIDLVYNVFDNHFYVGTLKVTTGGVVVLNNIAQFVPAGGVWGAVAMGSNGLIYGLNSGGTSQLSAINVVTNTSFSVANISPGVTSGNSDAASFMCASGIFTAICAGASATLSAANLFALANPVYSIQPGGQVQANPVFTVSPLITTSYTIYATGSNSVNATVTQSVAASVTVNPQPSVAPTSTQSTCSNTLNSVNLNLGFNPPSPVPNYTVSWNPTPPGVVSPTQTSASGLSAGVTNVTVTSAGGCSATAAFSMSPVPAPADFTITPAGSVYSLTCTNTLITLNAAPQNYTYTWISLGNSLSGASASFTQNMQGTYTVTGNNGIAGCNTTQTITIGQNTLAPTSTVSPAGQTITCNSGSPVTFTGICSNPTVNIQMDWYSPLNPLPGGVPIATSNNTISIMSGMVPPGVYTMVTTNLVNGCTTQKTVTVSSLSAWPTFSLASSTNFSVGCSPLNQTTISIINPVSTQTPPATCSYTFLAPSFTGAVTPSVVLGGGTSTVTTIPGTWTVIVQDNSNFCRTQIPVPVIQNTIAPNVSASMLTQTLTCYHPTVLATGSSTTANTNIGWLMPVVPPGLASPTLIIGAPPTGPNTSTSSLNYATFTVVATNTVNACQSSSVVVINQNFKPPVSSPLISLATPTAINCMAGSNPVVLTTGSSTTTSGGGPIAFVSNPCWSGPSPQTSTCGASSYSCYVPGVYTLTVMDNYNGCTGSGTVNVTDMTQLPVLLNPVETATIDCGSTSASLAIALSGATTGGVRILMTDYPAGAAFSPSNAAVENINPILSGTSNSLIVVNEAGHYYYLVSNTLTGCQVIGQFEVVQGSLTADFSADPAQGYAPLTVNFTNNSASSSGASGISPVWNFGNGTSLTSTANVVASASYTSPGTYPVTLFVTKGSCTDSVTKSIKVDLPSKMEVPNIFTPNGDGNNDVFFLKTANLEQISCVIVDRWGNKVYETASSTGNILWDGKDMNGKECAAGVYFYIIKAKGKDDKAYEAKGNVTLVR